MVREDKTMADKKISENPTIADTIVFDILTPDATGCFNANPYKVERAVVYYVERSFASGNDQQYSKVRYDENKLAAATAAEMIVCASPSAANVSEAQRLRAIADASVNVSPVYFNHALPVKVFGTFDNPAWLSSDVENAQIDLVALDANGNEQFGHFQLRWKPRGEAREGDYFICWTWAMQPAGDSQSTHLPFNVGGATQITTSIPTHFTDADKYETLLDAYLPQMFKEYATRSDLTPIVLSKINNAIAKGFTQIEDLANQIIDLQDANSTHEALIPYLSNIFNLKLKSNDPTLWRRQVKRAVPLFKQKGTLKGLKEAMSQAGMELTKFTRLWQVVSSYTWVDEFKIITGYEDSFSLAKPYVVGDSSNFELSYRPAGQGDYTALDPSLASFSTIDPNSNTTLDCSANITIMTWLGETSILLMPGDILKVRYQHKVIPNNTEQQIENYIRSLTLADLRDETLHACPRKNWNVRMIEDDDPLFDIVIGARNPFYDELAFGKVRTEFPYSENIYNMDEYNGCVVSSTKVNTYDSISEIGDRCGESLTLLTEHGYRKCEIVKSQGVRKTLKVETKMGRTLVITPNHEFRVISDIGQLYWKRADSLEVGDCILGKRGNPSLPTSRGVDKNTYYMAGLVYGDGRLNRSSIHLMVPESELETKVIFQEYLLNHNSKFNVREIMPEEHRRHVDLNCNQSMWRISTSRLHANELGQLLPAYEPKGGWKRHVPEQLWSSGEDQICCFLRGLFDTDGGVQKKSVLLTSKWKSLCEDVQTLLLQVGILSTVTQHAVAWKGEQRTYYRTRVIGQKSISKFVDKIGFAIIAKRDRLIEAMSSDSNLVADRTVLPNAGTLVRTIFPKKGKKSNILLKDRSREEKRVLAMVIRFRQGSLHAIPDNCVDLILQKSLEFGKDCPQRDFLRDYVSEGWFFDKVRAVSDDGEHEVFDPINVKQTRSYLTNGLVSHNSTRESTDPCDISCDFLDECSGGVSSKFMIDLNIQELSNDKLIEATEVVTENVPFHAVLHSINVSGVINEFVPSPTEEVECLVTYVISDSVLSGQANSVFHRIMDQPKGTNLVKRSLLASTQEVISEQPGIVHNASAALYCPEVNFELLGLGTNNVLEIFSPSPHAGNYTVRNPYRNTVELTTGFEPINQAAFTFRLSTDVYNNPSASVFQDNIVKLTGVNFGILGVKSRWDVDNSSYTSGPWRAVLASGQFIVRDVMPDGSLLLEDPSSLLVAGTSSNVVFGIVNGAGANVPLVPAGTTIPRGALSVVKRGRLQITDVFITNINDTVLRGDFLSYADNQYHVSGFVVGTTDQAYIDGYSLGTVVGVPIRVYRRLVTTGIGYMHYKGIRLQTFMNLEEELGIVNGDNASTNPDDILESNHFTENFLVSIEDDYYQIVEINGNIVTLAGPMYDYRTLNGGGTVHVYSIIRFVKTPITIDPSSPVLIGNRLLTNGTYFSKIDRSGGDQGEHIQNATEFAPYVHAMNVKPNVGGAGDDDLTALGMGSIMMTLNDKGGSEIREIISQDEGVSYTIEYRDDKTEQWEI